MRCIVHMSHGGAGRAGIDHPDSDGSPTHLAPRQVPTDDAGVDDVVRIAVENTVTPRCSRCRPGTSCGVGRSVHGPRVVVARRDAVPVDRRGRRQQCGGGARGAAGGDGLAPRDRSRGERRTSRPVSRVLFRRSRDRRWRPSISACRCRQAPAVHPQARAGRPRTPAQNDLRRSFSTLLRVGFTEPSRSPGMLVVSYTTVSPSPTGRTRSAVCSLWHCPAGHPGSLLATTLPCGARTFLGDTGRVVRRPRSRGRRDRPVGSSAASAEPTHPPAPGHLRTTRAQAVGARRLRSPGAFPGPR